MILYFDTSALVKRYVIEAGSDEVNYATEHAATSGTALITRAEVTAALAKAVRIGVLKQRDALASLEKFRSEWSDLIRLQVSESLVARADTLAWEHGLRGYDAVHLAAALVWQEMLGESVTLATFDQHLWAATRQVGLIPFPADFPTPSKTPKASGSSK